MNRDNVVARAIRQRDIGSIVRLMTDGDPPSIRSGFRTETELWDFKSDCPKLGRQWLHAWADLAKEVLAFHNNQGGILLFGVGDDFKFRGATTRLDSKLLNDQLRRFLGDRIWIEYHREVIQANQRYLGLALIPPRGPTLERFKASAPLVSGRRIFVTKGAAVREGDSTRVLSPQQADALGRSLSIPTVAKVFEIDEPFFRILSPEYRHFVRRAKPCDQVEAALGDPRAGVASIVGLGGVGKTALATWAVQRAYDREDFEFIVSMTAKDRELTSSGIQALEPTLTSFETLLNSVLDVLLFPELKSRPLAERESEVRNLLEDGNGLLYVDNLETVDDARIIRFIDSLPVGTRAITTSRRTTVRTSVHPVDLGPLEEAEIVDFIAALAKQPGFSYAADLSSAECSRIGESCDGVPLAIRWALARSGSAQEAVASAESVTQAGQRGEEILEFCFRRVFEAVPGPEQTILKVLSLFQRPVPSEALLVAANIPPFKLLDATETLLADALLQRLFDPDTNDYSYKLLPMTRAFVYAQVVREPPFEEHIRKTLRDWYEARDIKDSGERLVIREVRQGKGGRESALPDLATAAERRGDLEAAQSLYEQALRTNPSSWKAARKFGEFLRHKLGNVGEALRLYERAAGNAPRRGSDRALIFREWGMLLRDSGEPQATDRAIDCFETALAETPNDVLAIHALAHMRHRNGHWGEVIRLLEPLASHPNSRTREKSIPLLIEAYSRSGEILKAAELKRLMEDSAS